MFAKSFFKNAKISLLMIPLVLSLSSCVYLVVGSLGAVGGYVISPDTVEGLTENDEISVWDATMEIISIMGTIEEKHEDGGIIVAKINGNRVDITIIPISSSMVKLRVKARRAFVPKISVAQDVFVKVMTHLNE